MESESLVREAKEAQEDASRAFWHALAVAASPDANDADKQAYRASYMACHRAADKIVLAVLAVLAESAAKHR